MLIVDAFGNRCGVVMRDVVNCVAVVCLLLCTLLVCVVVWLCNTCCWYVLLRILLVCGVLVVFAMILHVVLYVFMHIPLQ